MTVARAWLVVAAVLAALIVLSGCMAIEDRRCPGGGVLRGDVCVGFINGTYQMVPAANWWRYD